MLLVTAAGVTAAMILDTGAGPLESLIRRLVVFGVVVVVGVVPLLWSMHAGYFAPRPSAVGGVTNIVRGSDRRKSPRTL